MTSKEAVTIFPLSNFNSCASILLVATGIKGIKSSVVAVVVCLSRLTNASASMPLVSVPATTLVFNTELLLKLATFNPVKPVSPPNPTSLPMTIARFPSF